MRKMWLFAFAAASASGAHAAPIACDWSHASPDPDHVQRSLKPEDLIELRDIGLSGSSDAPLSMSPDGKHVAFQLRQANLTRDNYCFAMVILDLDGSNRLRTVDTGGQVILNKTPWDGRVLNIPNGVPQTPVAKWSPDGRSIAYLRRDEGVTQVWRADVTGDAGQPVTTSPTDVEDFAWSADGASIIFSTRPNLAAAKATIDAEARRGFHYDARFFPFEDSRPIPTDGGEPKVQRIDLDTGQVRTAAPPESALLEGSSFSSGTGREDIATGLDGRKAKVQPADPDRIFNEDEITIRDPSGRDLPCRGPTCRGAIKGIWWGADGSLYFFKRDGWARSRSSLYRWSLTAPTPRMRYSTEGLITGCVAVQLELVCLREGAIEPRRLVTIDLRNGSVHTIFDPNPGFANIALAPVRRLHWSNAFGIQTFGDLVLPVNRRLGERLPLVIVQYESRGFLRGGTGDEVPIQLLAQSGMAVLSLQRPRDYGEFLPAKSGADLSRNDFKDLMDRQSVNSSLTAGIKMLVDQGLVDPERVGISGLSDGASTIQFALVNGARFAAVGMAQCCEEDESRAYGGPSVSEHFQKYGVPKPGDRTNIYWQRLSIVQAADLINTPILIQISDTEYLDSLVPWTILRAKNKPIDMFVFPNEHHIKLEPLHRLALYKRYIAWFSFWLQNRIAPDLSDADAERWLQWKNQRGQK